LSDGPIGPTIFDSSDMCKKYGGRFIRNGNCFHRDQLGSPPVFVGGSVLLIVFVYTPKKYLKSDMYAVFVLKSCETLVLFF
jgi:hypothetical protein